MKKLILTASLLMLALSAWATQTVTIDDIIYTLYDEDGTKYAIVTGSSSSILHEKTIASYVGDGYKVTGIGNGAFADKELQFSITIPNTVTII